MALKQENSDLIDVQIMYESFHIPETLQNNYLFSNHSAVKREQIIFTLENMKRRQESGIGISFIDS